MNDQFLQLTTFLYELQIENNNIKKTKCGVLIVLVTAFVKRWYRYNLKINLLQSGT